MAKQPTFNAKMRMVLLHGKEQFLMQRYSEMIQEALVSDYGDIDVVTFDGEQADLALVLDEVRTFDLLMRHKLIVIDKADSFVASKDSNGTQTLMRILNELQKSHTYVGRPTQVCGG